MIILILAFIAFTATTNAQIITWLSSCPDVQLKANFDRTKYLGQWYDMEHFPAYFQKGRCSSAHYSMRDDGRIKVNNTQIMPDGTSDSVIGYLQKNAINNEPACLEVRFSEWQPRGYYLVLDTDYVNYSVVYSCTNLYVGKFELLWILSRRRTLAVGYLEHIHDLLDSYGIDTTRIEVEYCDSGELGYCHQSSKFFNC
ncbi:apolipoprotein D-like [Branchiostoma floridae x Branchiostoma japonicum]